MKTVLDASALLAYLQDEPGEEMVRAVLADSSIPSVNWAEVVQKVLAAGIDINKVRQSLQAMGLVIELFTPEDGEMAGKLWSQTRSNGLSLGDRACLALGMRLEATVLTGDRAWESLMVSVDVQLIR
jgi:ribonuclease VapC